MSLDGPEGPPDGSARRILLRMSPQFAITTAPLSIERLTADLELSHRHRDEGCGAVCAFVGTVRVTHKGRQVKYLEYEAYEPLAMKALRRIEEEIAGRWPGTGVAIHHRVGRLTVGEASVVIVAASAHRAAAFQVCRYAIERVKQVLPVWKHEFFADGDAWVEGATADVDDDMARTRALDVACA